MLKWAWKVRGCRIAVCIIVMVLFWRLPTWLPAEESSLQVLDRLVGRWMDLRVTLASERRDWTGRRAQWEEEVELLSREAELLAEELNAIRGLADGAEEERVSLERRRAQLRGVLERLQPRIAQAEAALRLWETRVPVSLSATFQPAFDQLPVDPDSAQRLPLIERAQTVIAIYAQIEDLQNGIHVTRELLESDGQDANGEPTRQVDVLYIGLGRAFAVSSDADWAAVGTPAGSLWQWRRAPDLADTVLSAIRVFRRDVSAEIQLLPMQLVEPGDRP